MEGFLTSLTDEERAEFNDGLTNLEATLRVCGKEEEFILESLHTFTDSFKRRHAKMMHERNEEVVSI